MHIKVRSSWTRTYPDTLVYGVVDRDNVRNVNFVGIPSLLLHGIVEALRGREWPCLVLANRCSCGSISGGTHRRRRRDTTNVICELCQVLRDLRGTLRDLRRCNRSEALRLGNIGLGWNRRQGVTLTKDRFRIRKDIADIINTCWLNMITSSRECRSTF